MSGSYCTCTPWHVSLGVLGVLPGAEPDEEQDHVHRPGGAGVVQRGHVVVTA